MNLSIGTEEQLQKIVSEYTTYTVAGETVKSTVYTVRTVPPGLVTSPRLFAPKNELRVKRRDDASESTCNVLVPVQVLGKWNDSTLKVAICADADPAVISTLVYEDGKIVPKADADALRAVSKKKALCHYFLDPTTAFRVPNVQPGDVFEDAESKQEPPSTMVCTGFVLKEDENESTVPYKLLFKSCPREASEVKSGKTRAKRKKQENVDASNGTEPCTEPQFARSIKTVPVVFRKNDIVILTHALWEGSFHAVVTDVLPDPFYNEEHGEKLLVVQVPFETPDVTSKMTFEASTMLISTSVAQLCLLKVNPLKYSKCHFYVNSWSSYVHLHTLG